MSQSLKNVIIIGAGGNLGPLILDALISKPNFSVTVLSRASSKSQFPTNTKVKTVPDSYPYDDLVSAFENQDAIVDLAPLQSVPDHIKFIDAAIKAKVKRFIPGEYGSKTTEPRVNDAVPFFRAKVEVRDYLKSKESTGLTWTGIINGAFFDWGLRSGFLGFDFKEHRATIYGSGDAKTDVALLSTVGKATASVLEHAAETANKYVSINSFFVSQNEILAALEKASGKKWETTEITIAEANKVGKEKWDQGDFSGIVPLIAGMAFSGHEWVQHYGSDNKMLGLSQNEDLETVVAKIYNGEKSPYAPKHDPDLCQQLPDAKTVIDGNLEPRLKGAREQFDLLDFADTINTCVPWKKHVVMSFLLWPSKSRASVSRIYPNLSALSRGHGRSNNTSATAATGKIDARPIQSILIANRGEIALRVGKTASQYGIKITTVYTDPDARSQHALSSPHAINLGDASAYLDGDKIIEAAKKDGCTGIHPGYGFLSENATFAQKCSEAGLIFIGPPSEAIEAMGNKSRSKVIMTDAGVPCIPGYHGTNQDVDYLNSEASKIGFPVLLKAVKGGGGKGMRIAMTPETFFDQLESAKSEARSSFGDDVMLVEKYITTPRHIEVQVFADKHGNCVALGERDCSIQRRHQKILEESPAPKLEEAVRQDLWQKARAAALAVGYEGAGTVEFIFDNDSGEFFFMEMNTRLQVEHPVTEMVTGEDLVHWQIIVAEGGKLPLTQEDIEARIAKRGHAIEARIYAENPQLNFIPDSGRLTHLQNPTTTDNVRIDAGFVAGDDVSSHYDPMIAKLIVRGETREIAIQRLHAALSEYEIAGPITNVDFLKRVCQSPAFVAADLETGFITRWKNDLFKESIITPEIYAQAALGTYQVEAATSYDSLSHDEVQAGFLTTIQSREFHYARNNLAGTSDPGEVTVCVKNIGRGFFDVRVDDAEYTSVASHWDSASKTVTSYFPHKRLDTRFISEEGNITLFQQGQQYRFRCATPGWVGKALGLKDNTHSVLTPMPCKVLRVQVEEGDRVRKEQPLVVIESMKMETVIRSPQDGVVSRVVHRQGDICKAGTALVEFEQA